jgi:hypothetical protein
VNPLAEPGGRARSGAAGLGWRWRRRRRSAACPIRRRAGTRASPSWSGGRGRSTFEALLEWLENLSGMLGERLLRLKGIVAPSDAPGRVLVQAVGETFDPPRRFTGEGAEGIVVIARDTSPAEIAAMQPDFPLRLETQTAGPSRDRRRKA